MDTQKNQPSNVSLSQQQQPNETITNSSLQQQQLDEHTEQLEEQQHLRERLQIRLQQEERLRNAYWARHIIMAPIDRENNPLNFSPFAVQKGVAALSGSTTRVRKLRSGDLLIEVDRQAYSESFQSLQSFLGVSVICAPHRSLNSIMGVIRHPEMAGCDTVELVRELRGHGVTDAKPLGRFGTFLLTFQLAQLPTSVPAGYLRMAVTQYIPNPLRCYQCQRFGHGARACKKMHPVCERCGSLEHVKNSCGSECPRCVNCAGEHEASSKKCPRYVKEARIQRVRVENKLSFPEARRVVEQNATTYLSYSQIVKQNINLTPVTQQVQPNRSAAPVVLRDSETQTDISWVSEYSISLPTYTNGGMPPKSSGTQTYHQSPPRHTKTPPKSPSPSPSSTPPSSTPSSPKSRSQMDITSPKQREYSRKKRAREQNTPPSRETSPPSGAKERKPTPPAITKSVNIKLVNIRLKKMLEQTAAGLATPSRVPIMTALGRPPERPPEHTKKVIKPISPP